MRIIFFVVLVILIAGCKPKQRSASEVLRVITTTGMLYDAVINIGKDKVEATSIMGPGVDPHLYKATQGDLIKLREADVIIYNGLYLEGKMSEILAKLSRTKPVFAAASGIPEGKLKSSQQYEDAYDPHIWFDVSLWQIAVKEISKALQNLDTANASYYQENTERYIKALDTLHQYAKDRIAEIPESRRILVTAHDAFGYFGDAYDIQVEGLQGISTVSDFGLRDISEITDLIIEKQVKAIFVETSVSDKAIKAVVTGCREKGHDVVIGGKLYSDAMGPFGTYEGTYIGMVRSNVDTIVEALK